MRRRLARVTEVAGAVALAAIVISACGSKASPGPDQPAPTRAALVAAGWTVASGAGMAPMAGGRQLAYFDARAPSGFRVSLQILDSARRAERERVLASQQATAFRGVAIGNVLAFSSPDGTVALPSTVLVDLRHVLKG